MNFSLNQLQGTERILNSSQFEQEPLFELREFTELSNFTGGESIISDYPTEQFVRINKKAVWFKSFWRLIGLILAIYSAIVIPFFVAFMKNRTLFYTIIDLIIDIYFVIDFIFIMKSLKNAKKMEGIHCLDKIKIYLSSTFIIDFFSTFPIDKVLYLFYPIDYSAIVIIELLKVLRIRRITLMSHNRPGAFIKMVQVVFSFIILIHVTGCIWFIVVRIDKDWIPYQDKEENETSLYTTSLWNKYFICLHEGIWLIFGQEIAPKSLLEIWVACFFISLGIFIMSYMFGNILMIVSGFGLKYKMRKKSLEFCLEITNKINLPKDLRLSILAYIMNIYPTLSSQEEFEQFFKYISPSLQHKVLKYVYRPILNLNELFEFDKNLAEFLLNRLRYQFFLPEEDIVIEGTRAHDFYILAKGACAVFVKTRQGKKSNLGFLNEGKIFGEIGLLYKTYRTATITSHGYSTVANLTKQEFKTVTNAFPYIVDKLKENILNYNDPWKDFIVSSLNQSRVFDSLPIQVTEELVYKMKIIKLQPGEFLFKAKEPIAGVYLLASGSLHLTTGLANKSSQNFIFKSKTLQTENQDSENYFLTLSLNKSRKIKAEIIPIINEEFETEGDNPTTGQLDVGLLSQGTLIYPRTGLKLHILHKLDCKAIEPCTVYWVDHYIIRGLAKEHENFKKLAECKDPPDYFEFLHPDPLSFNLKFIFRKNVAKVVFANREARELKNNKLKEMLNLLKAVVACQNAGNNQLADLVMRDKINYKYITPEGSVDLAYLYKGSLPQSNPVLKKFESVLSNTNKGSVLKQCGSMNKELGLLIPKVKNTKERIVNSIGLMETFINQIK